MEGIGGFKVYKELQRPLVFKNLKGKFIGWGAAALITSFLLCVLVGNLVGVLFGMVTLIVSFVLSMSFILYKQSQGLHSRDSGAGYYIVRRIVRGKLDL